MRNKQLIKRCEDYLESLLIGSMEGGMDIVTFSSIEGSVYYSSDDIREIVGIDTKHYAISTHVLRKLGELPSSLLGWIPYSNRQFEMRELFDA